MGLKYSVQCLAQKNAKEMKERRRRGDEEEGGGEGNREAGRGGRRLLKFNFAK